MRWPKYIGILVVFVILTSGCVSGAITDPGIVNKMIEIEQTPVIEPGGQGQFMLALRNPTNGNVSMENITLTTSIYFYTTIDEALDVSSIQSPPSIYVDGERKGTEYVLSANPLAPNESREVSFYILTNDQTPHGSYFKQSTYFVRFMLAFTFENQSYAMASRGYFNDTEWDWLTNSEVDESGINRTYLSELGYDGILPDSSFSLFKPIPMWPFYVLVALTIFFAFIAFSYYILDNPGKYPKLEKRLQQYRGKFHQFRRLQKHGLGRSGGEVDVPPGDEESE